MEDKAKEYTEKQYYKVDNVDEFNGEPLAVYRAYKQCQEDMADVGYKIIIPQEEPKQETLTQRVSSGLDRELQRQKKAGKQFLSDDEIDKLVDNIIKEEMGDAWKESYEKAKQETTLEEAAKEFANNSASCDYEEGINVGKYQGFIEGAKWQQDMADNWLTMKEGEGWDIIMAESGSWDDSEILAYIIKNYNPPTKKQDNE
jgi:hypothetical protein